MRQIDVSCHFNAFEQTSAPRGCEVFYVSQKQLADEMSAAIADAGFVNRGGKKPETSLYFLSNTEMPALLLEICFVDSEADCEIYQRNYDLICENIAAVLSGDEVIAAPDPEPEALFTTTGRCSHFGGPDGTSGVSDQEGLHSSST